MSTAAKSCTNCGEAKPLAEFNAKRGVPGAQSWCKECQRQYSRAYTSKRRAADPEAVRQAWREWYVRRRSTPEGLDADRERQRRATLRYAFDLTPEDYSEMLAAQGGTCGLCDATESPDGRRLAVDHDRSCCPENRSCGACIRGLLCMVCNTRLGWVEQVGVEQVTAWLR